MNKEVLTFGCIEVEKCEYCKVITRYITRFLEKKGYKYFIDYKDEEEVTPWCFMHSQISMHARNFCWNYLSFLTEDAELLKRYNKFWDQQSIKLAIALTNLIVNV